MPFSSKEGSVTDSRRKSGYCHEYAASQERRMKYDMQRAIFVIIVGTSEFDIIVNDETVERFRL
jgi:hypothetical protein